MKLNALKTFGMDLSGIDQTKGFAERFPECPDKTLEIDFSGCIIDYPASSTIIDAALRALARLPPPRELEALFNINFNERVFLKAFFIGSQCLGLASGPVKEDDLRSRVIAKLREMSIVVRVRIVHPKSKTELACFTYGQ